MKITKNNLYKGQKHNKLTPKGEPLLGCIYRGDTGNSNWITGILIKTDPSDSILRDARGKEHVVMTMMLRSVQ